MISVTQCLECGVDISPDAKGLCPKCTLKLGLASQISGYTEAGAQGASLLGFDAHNASRASLGEPFEFGTYRISRLLGKGGMGAVYEAEDLPSGRRVALKVLGHSLDSPETRKRFIREGRLAASINHPNSVYVYGTEEIEGAPVIIMELVEGGTLHDLVKGSGPMPVARAVDAMLQAIAGLESAHAAGILHRDIKPSNCFIDSSGTVKIGDFGLSVSTVSRVEHGESALTLAGSILGTPEFSSPEQLRGEELSVRSDIYSVGMTLYYLLTGKTPFHGDNVMQCLATVLEKPAPSPRKVRPEIPDGLARIVLRCLAKQAGDRFANYDELRSALLPYNSTAPTPATLGLRFAAGAIDYLCLASMNMLITVVMFPDILAYTDPGLSDPWGAMWFGLGTLSLQLVYFAVPEGVWGASAGKALMGLRVARIDRSAPGIPKALLRVVIYFLPTLANFALQFLNPGGWDFATANSVLGLAAILYTIAIFSTVRRRNGFAGVHDLLTKTRVIQKSAYEPRAVVQLAQEPVVAAEALPKHGPYHLLATLSSAENEMLMLGYDSKLLRRVWIRQMSASAPTLAAARRSVARPGRLRWLQGDRTATEAWDAYEATLGTPLVNLLRAPQPWQSVRCWLLDVAEELAAASRDGSLPPVLALECVWINADGRAKLLDFPAPGAQPTAPSLQSMDARQPDALPVFLNQLAISALEGGGAVSVDEARSRAPRVPLPLAARNLLDGLRTTTDFGALIARLKALGHETPYVSRRRRLGLIAGCTLPAVIFAGFMFAGVAFVQRWEKDNPEFEHLRRSLSRHNEYRGQTSAPSIEIYIAGHFGDFIRDARKWNSQPPKSLPSKWRHDAEKIVAAYPHPTPEEMQRAHAELAPHLDEHGRFKSRSAKSRDHDKQIVEKGPYMLAGGLLGFAAASSIFCALAFRGGLLLRLLGIAVVKDDGGDASRLRIVWRALIAWSPLFVGAWVLSALTSGVPLPAKLAGPALLMIVPVIFSSTLRGRSLQDRLAGTWLVPR
jgi:uncharacterized RDD family membrane protein YckC/tRNA A-37 threonylcarbamoyl transferase component Bud32